MTGSINLSQPCLEAFELLFEFFRQLVAELLIKFGNAFRLSGPEILIHFQDGLQGVEAQIQTLKVDILAFGT